MADNEQVEEGAQHTDGDYIPNAGHAATLEAWEKSDAGKEFIKNAKDSDEKDVAEAQKPVFEADQKSSKSSSGQKASEKKS